MSNEHKMSILHVETIFWESLKSLVKKSTIFHCLKNQGNLKWKSKKKGSKHARNKKFVKRLPHVHDVVGI